MKVRNTFIIFIVSGFWHGANWTFIVWGALNAIYFLPLLLTKNNRNNLDVVAQDRYLPTFKEFLAMLLTFSLTVFAWIFFRANSVSHALEIINGICTIDFFQPISDIAFNNKDRLNLLHLALTLCVLLILEWKGRRQHHALAEESLIRYSSVRWLSYIVIILMIIYLGGAEQEFIYFAF